MDSESIETLPNMEAAKELAPLSKKEQFQIACQIITDISLTASGCFEEMCEETKDLDKELYNRCIDAKKALDLVVSHIVCKVS